MADEPTADELIDIANSMLLSAPPGELMEVVGDLKALIPDKSMLNATAARTFREYNTEQMVQAETASGRKVLITKYGEVGPGEYVDPKGKEVVTYDHIQNKVTGSKPAAGSEMDSSVESLRAAVEKEATAYTEEHYPHGTCAVYGKDGKVIICISSARFNPNNFWNGRWRSVWTISGGKCSGHLKLVVHYYEDGNVQLNTDTKLSASASASDAKAIVAAIAAAESAFQQALGKSYMTMGDTTFKALRRALPITRSKVDWSKILAYKVGISRNA